MKFGMDDITLCHLSAGAHSPTSLHTKPRFVCANLQITASLGLSDKSAI
jgi:hypothetical protein